MTETIRGGRNMGYWGAFFDEALVLDIKGESPFSTSVYPGIRVNSKNKQVIQTLCNEFPLGDDPKIPKFARDSWYWASTNPRICGKFLLGIEPWLVTKKEQVNYLIDVIYLQLLIQTTHDGSEPEVSLPPKSELLSKFNALKKRPYKRVYVPSSAQVAGILDFSGGISIAKVPGTNRYNYSTEVKLHSRHLGLLQGLEQKYPGSHLYPTSDKRASLSLNRWVATGRASRAVLEDILSSLRFRRQIAQSALEFQRFQEESQTEHLQSLLGKPRFTPDTESLARRIAGRKERYLRWVEEKIKAGEGSRIIREFR